MYTQRAGQLTWEQEETKIVHLSVQGPPTSIVVFVHKGPCWRTVSEETYRPQAKVFESGSLSFCGHDPVIRRERNNKEYQTKDPCYKSYNAKRFSLDRHLGDSQVSKLIDSLWLVVVCCVCHWLTCVGGDRLPGNLEMNYFIHYTLSPGDQMISCESPGLYSVILLLIFFHLYLNYAKCSILTLPKPWKQMKRSLVKFQNNETYSFKGIRQTHFLDISWDGRSRSSSSCGVPGDVGGYTFPREKCWYKYKTISERLW